MPALQITFSNFEASKQQKSVNWPFDLINKSKTSKYSGMVHGSWFMAQHHNFTG